MQPTKKINVIESFKEYCAVGGIPFEEIRSPLSYNDTTLFCPAGMQRFTEWYKDPTSAQIPIGALGLATNQTCLRLNDLHNLTNTHYLLFDMLGFFSFGQCSLQFAIDFWTTFLKLVLKLPVHYTTVHPDKFEEWSKLHQKANPDSYVIPDTSCIWTDGADADGYCTEFYVEGIEVGNIVNTKGQFIDCGFGTERLQQLCDPSYIPLTREQKIFQACNRLIEFGVVPSNKNQGYVLRKLLREIYHLPELQTNFSIAEKERQEKIQQRYIALRDKHKDKSPEWWFDTHGIDITTLTK